MAISEEEYQMEKDMMEWGKLFPHADLIRLFQAEIDSFRLSLVDELAIHFTDNREATIEQLREMQSVIDSGQESILKELRETNRHLKQIAEQGQPQMTLQSMEKGLDSTVLGIIFWAVLALLGIGVYGLFFS